MATLHILQAQRAPVCDREDGFPSKSQDDLFASLPTAAASFAVCTSPPVPQERILTWSKLAQCLISISCPPFREGIESPMVRLLEKVAKATAMKSLDIRVLLFLISIVSASLAHPSNTRSESLTLDNEVSPGIKSQINLANLDRSHSVYPTTCFPFPSYASPVPLPDVANMLSDCYWIINEILLNQDLLLLRDLLFGHSCFKDESGNQYLSRWHRGQCVIKVTCEEKFEEQRLQLYNVVFAANEIVEECVQGQQILQGGTVPIGSPTGFCYVGVLGEQDSEAADENNVSPLSTLELPGQDMRSPQRINPKKKSFLDDCDANNSAFSRSPSVSGNKRAFNPQHGSSLSRGTSSLIPEDELSTSDLVLPSRNLSESVKAPLSYPVECFDPYSIKVRPALLKDCEFIISHIILTYPNPMTRQTFAYANSADIDLSLPQNEKWAFGECVMFVANANKARMDTFRMVDVADTADRIMRKCVSGNKYPEGGTADIGTVAGNFYVGVGAL